MYERRWDHKKLISEEIFFEKKYFEEETSGEKSF